jgi:hypothetical protein
MVYGTADAWALRRRIRRKLKRHADVVSDGSAPYYGTTDAPYYGSSEAYGYGATPPQHAYYSQPPLQRHGYYSHPAPPPPPPEYSYATRGYDGWAVDRDPYGYRYAADSSVPLCSIM